MDSISSKNSKVYIVIVVYQMVQQLDLTMFLELFLLIIGERSKRAAKGMVFVVVFSQAPFRVTNVHGHAVSCDRLLNHTEGHQLNGHDALSRKAGLRLGKDSTGV